MAQSLLLALSLEGTVLLGVNFLLRELCALCAGAPGSIFYLGLGFLFPFFEFRFSLGFLFRGTVTPDCALGLSKFRHNPNVLEGAPPFALYAKGGLL